MFKVTGDMTIMEVLKKDMEVAEIFIKYGLECLGCPGATMETIEDAGRVHGIDAGKLIEDLNRYFQDMNKG